MRTKQEIAAEIRRVRAALEKTTSPHLKRDYGKYLKKLERAYRESEG